MDFEEGQEYVREQAWELIAPGLWELDDVLDQLADLVDHDDDMPMTGADSSQIVRELWARRVAELAVADGTAPGDHEAVIRAFQAIGTAGIIVGFGLGFDNSEARAECEAILQDQGHGRGYLYFHAQDAARLAYPNANLYVGFGAVPDQGTTFGSESEFDLASKAIAQQAVRALKAEGLNVVWNGSPDQRILLTGLDWRHPLPES